MESSKSRPSSQSTKVPGASERASQRRKAAGTPAEVKCDVDQGKEQKAIQPKASEQSAKPDQGTLDHIRQWQRYYKKVFPDFVVFFDNVIDDVRDKALRQIASLGAVGANA